MNADDALDRALAAWFQEALAVAEDREASWRRFQTETLPEKQAWIAFSRGVIGTQRRLRQATRWAGGRYRRPGLEDLPAAA